MLVGVHGHVVITQRRGEHVARRVAAQVAAAKRISALAEEDVPVVVEVGQEAREVVRERPGNARRVADLARQVRRDQGLVEGRVEVVRSGIRHGRVADVDVVLVGLLETTEPTRSDPHVDAERRHGSVAGIRLAVRQERIAGAKRIERAEPASRARRCARTGRSAATDAVVHCVEQAGLRLARIGTEVARRGRLVIVDVPASHSRTRNATSRCVVVEREPRGERIPVGGKRDGVVREDAEEVVAHRHGARDVDVDQTRVRTRRGPQVEDAVTQRVTDADAREVGIRDLTDRRRVRPHPDHEELVLGQNVKSRELPEQVLAHGQLDDCQAGLERGDVHREAERARVRTARRDLSDDIAVSVVQELRLLAGEARGRACKLDTAPVLDDVLAVKERKRDLGDVPTGGATVEALRDVAPGSRPTPGTARSWSADPGHSGPRLLRHPRTPWKPWRRVPRAGQTSVSYACCVFPPLLLFPQKDPPTKATTSTFSATPARTLLSAASVIPGLSLLALDF